MLGDQLPCKEAGVLRGEVLQEVDICLSSNLDIAIMVGPQLLVDPASQSSGSLQSMPWGSTWLKTAVLHISADALTPVEKFRQHSAQRSL